MNLDLSAATTARGLGQPTRRTLLGLGIGGGLVALLGRADAEAKKKRKRRKKRCKPSCLGGASCTRGRCRCPNGEQYLSKFCQACATVTLEEGPPERATFTIQKAAGLTEVLVTRSENADTVVPPFTPGTTDPVVASSAKIDQTQPARIEMRVTTADDNVSLCDLTF